MGALNNFANLFRKTSVAESIVLKVTEWKPKILTQLFSCEICKLFKNTYFCRTASGDYFSIGAPAQKGLAESSHLSTGQYFAKTFSTLSKI